MTQHDLTPAAVARRLVDEVWNQVDAVKRSRALRDLHPPQIANEGTATTLDQLEAWHFRMRETYPDLRYQIDELIEADEHVTMRWTATGTQRGSLWGLVPPTNQRVSWRGIHLLTVSSGRIRAVWAAANTVDVLQQLGVRLGPPESPTE